MIGKAEITPTLKNYGTSVNAQIQNSILYARTYITHELRTTIKEDITQYESAILSDNMIMFYNSNL